MRLAPIAGTFSAQRSPNGNEAALNRDSRQVIVDDRLLVARAKKGDSSALGQLMSRYQDRIFNTCLRLCGREADALDLTQATFMRAMDALPRFEARSSFFTWLYRIAVNLSLSHRRAERPMATLSSQPDFGAFEPADARTQASASGLECRELCDRVQAALNRLDEEFRAAVVLKDVEELDYVTIGEILGIPIGTVKSRIFRGRMMLRELLMPEVGRDVVA